MSMEQWQNDNLGNAWKGTCNRAILSTARLALTGSAVTNCCSQPGAVRCVVVRCSAVRRGAARCGAVQCGAVRSLCETCGTAERFIVVGRAARDVSGTEHQARSQTHEHSGCSGLQLSVHMLMYVHNSVLYIYTVYIINTYIRIFHGYINVSLGQ